MAGLSGGMQHTLYKDGGTMEVCSIRYIKVGGLSGGMSIHYIKVGAHGGSMGVCIIRYIRVPADESYR